MQISMESFTISGVVLIAFVILITIYSSRISKMIQTLVRYISNSVKGTSFDSSASILLNVVNDVIIHAEHTIIAELLKASEDGVLTANEIEQIVEKVHNEVVALISPELKKAMGQFIFDLDAWLCLQIRNRINEINVANMNKSKAV